MRKIKFRAWIDESDLCNREELHEHLNDNDEFIPFMQNLNDWYFDDGQTLGDYLSNFGIGNVMQYTGLKLNGEEIYEGDILKWTSKDTDGSTLEAYAVVDFEEGCFVWREGHIVRGTLKEEIDYNKLFEKIEIVGNVFENPELLE